MTSAVTLKAEARLNDTPWYDHAGEAISDHADSTILLYGVWDDTFAEDIVEITSLDVGMGGGTILDRVARPGIAQFTLKNSAQNYHSTLGYWSPKHASARSGWGKKTEVRIGLQKAGGSTVWWFVGKVESITPMAGAYRERTVEVTAFDYMHDLQEDSEVKRIVILENATSDQAYAALIAAASSQPAATDFSTGVIEMPAVFHQATGKNVRIYEEIVRIATSNFEYVYITKDGTLKSQNMVDRLIDQTVQFTLDNTMRDVTVSESAKDIPRKFTFSVYPTRVGTAREVVASIGSPVRINAGETIEFEVKYRDPSGGSQLAAKNLATPVADTDFIFSTIEGSEYGDYNDKLSLTITDYATLVSVTATNNGGAVGWLNKFEPRGFAIRTDDEVSRSVEIAGAEGAEVKVNLYYQVAPSIAKSAGTMATNVYGVSYAQSVNFKAHASETILDGFLETDIGQRIAIAEDVTGVNSEFFVNGISWEYRSNYDIDVTYILGPARSETPWVVGTSKVGSGKVLFSGG